MSARQENDDRHSSETRRRFLQYGLQATALAIASPSLLRLAAPPIVAASSSARPFALEEAAFRDVRTQYQTI